ncbi:unnamed protein product [Rotaria sp. Silwood1]|nr:unnamed protein product [Rotaria sp. Silwood1]CAF1372020.1 unnamed protein product [Rotaria sp. Silwood1]
MNTVSSNVFHRRLDVEPLYAIRAEGNYIYTKDGRKILDGGVGSGVTTIGYGHKRVTEVVGATSGCTLAMPGYFKAMREVCDRHGALFVLDEIMCGIGRTGKLHAWQWENLSSPPDIQVNGKGLAGGYARIGAILVSAKVIDMLSAGSVALYPCSKRTFDGISGDHIIIAPPYTITEQELVFLVDSLKASIDIVLQADPV